MQTRDPHLQLPPSVLAEFGIKVSCVIVPLNLRLTSYTCWMMDEVASLQSVRRCVSWSLRHHSRSLGDLSNT